MLGMMDVYRTLRVRQLLFKVGGIAIGLVFALLATLKDLFSASILSRMRSAVSTTLTSQEHQGSALRKGATYFTAYSRDTRLACISCSLFNSLASRSRLRPYPASPFMAARSNQT